MEEFQNAFGMIVGVIVDMVAADGAGPAEGCVSLVTVEEDDGNVVNFLMSPDTFVVDWETIEVGERCMFWYRMDAPALLIYPPQYMAVVAAKVQNGRMIDVGHYDAALVNTEHTLQLKMGESVKLRTTNNQYFRGNPADHDLVVLYENSTRSIPAQTTPNMVVVLCNMTWEE